MYILNKLYMYAGKNTTKKQHPRVLKNLMLTKLDAPSVGYL